MHCSEVFHVPTSRAPLPPSMLIDTLRSWAEEEIISKRLEYSESYENLILPAMKSLFLDIGMQRMAFPENVGGDGEGNPSAALTLVRSLEEISRADTGIAFALCGTWAACLAFTCINQNDKLCEALAKTFCQGNKPASISLIMPTYGNRKEADLICGKHPQVSVAKNGDGLRVTGEDARAHVNGENALFFSAAFTNDKKEPSLIVIPCSEKGVSKGERILRTGFRSLPDCSYTFDTKIDDSHIAFSGSDCYESFISWYELLSCACIVGALFATYEILKEWGDTRVIKGKGCAFKNNPLTASVMSSAADIIYSSRALTHSLASFIASENGENPKGAESAFSSMVFQKVAADGCFAIDKAMEMMASAGYAREWNLERYWRDAKTISACLGAPEAAHMKQAAWYFGSENL